ncbi:sigma-54 interaction domain-containing protein [Falsibacillus pallidus]|uniref:Arginine utilization regulatory protein n=1 Tax=Falsibacillus pallidus TaxID=493781 RepID=A0A370FZM7_9BACI|nr:sigma 54-interacting transcriptional regulator [Falsibacillus pallidus]RDI36915.1 arginine utilization regulatory protein [Falsibacillus pallidus]
MKQSLFIYEKIIDAIDSGVHAIDSEGRTIIYNKKMRQIEGMEISDVLDKNILDVFKFHQFEESTLMKVLNTGDPILNVKQTYFNNKGHEITTINDTYPIFDNGRLIGAMEIARDVTKLERIMRNHTTSDHLQSFLNIIGTSRGIHQAINQCRQLASSEEAVLISGESGTGKSLFASILHHEGANSSGPFIVQNCSSLDESSFFGKKEDTHYPSMFEQALGGTLLLEGINSLSIQHQEKLLKVIQDNVIESDDANASMPLETRIIMTINEDPIDSISSGRLLKDLFYKVSPFTIFIPSLKDRKTDIPLLVQYFISKYNERFGLHVEKASEEVSELFEEYDWPGNVRELELIIESGMSMMGADSEINPEHLPIYFRQRALGEIQNSLIFDRGTDIKPLEQYIKEAEMYYIHKALNHHGQNVTKTAKALGMSRQNLQYRIRKYEIDR